MYLWISRQSSRVLDGMMGWLCVEEGMVGGVCPKPARFSRLCGIRRRRLLNVHGNTRTHVFETVELGEERVGAWRGLHGRGVHCGDLIHHLVHQGRALWPARPRPHELKRDVLSHSCRQKTVRHAVLCSIFPDRRQHRSSCQAACWHSAAGGWTSKQISTGPHAGSHAHPPHPTQHFPHSMGCDVILRALEN